MMYEKLWFELNLKEMNRLGMIADISHVSVQTMKGISEDLFSFSRFYKLFFSNQI